MAFMDIPRAKLKPEAGDILSHVPTIPARGTISITSK
jgi:hypothetical protein